jgi:uncharacterized membrane protein
MWQLYALLSAVSIGFQRIINAYVVKTEDHLAYSWFATCLTSLFFMLLLIMMGDIALPTSLYAWALALIAGVLWTLITILGFKSYQLTPLSLRESLSRVDMLFLLFFFSVIVRGIHNPREGAWNRLYFHRANRFNAAKRESVWKIDR